jgi:hypothetical protein
MHNYNFIFIFFLLLSVSCSDGSKNSNTNSMASQLNASCELEKIKASNVSTQKEFDSYCNSQDKTGVIVRSHIANEEANNFLKIEKSIFFENASVVKFEDDTFIKDLIDFNFEARMNQLNQILDRIKIGLNAEPLNLQNIHKLKVLAESELDLKYNSKSTKIQNILDNKLMQCYSGTVFLSTLMQSYAGKSLFRSLPLVWIYQPNHMLIGYVNEGSLYGIEATSSGLAKINFGKLKYIDWSQTRVISAEIAMVLDSIKLNSDYKDIFSLGNQAIHFTNQKFSISQPDLSNERLNWKLNFSQKVNSANWSIFSVAGYRYIPEGTIARSNVDFSDQRSSGELFDEEKLKHWDNIPQDQQSYELKNELISRINLYEQNFGITTREQILSSGWELQYLYLDPNISPGKSNCRLEFNTLQACSITKIDFKHINGAFKVISNKEVDISQKQYQLLNLINEQAPTIPILNNGLAYMITTVNQQGLFNYYLLDLNYPLQANPVAGRTLGGSWYLSDIIRKD